jgi:hypothetical protein
MYGRGLLTLELARFGMERLLLPLETTSRAVCVKRQAVCGASVL